MARGKLVVLEGGEGAGKTTQIDLLVDRLAQSGVTAVSVREPGGDPVAEQLRQIVKHSEAPVTPLAEVFLFNAARAQMLELVVEPMLAQGTWVLSDRNYLSTLAYQGYGRGLDLTMLRHLCAYGASVVTPDAMLLLDVPLGVSRSRIASRDEKTDRFESEDTSFHYRVLRGYRMEAEHANLWIIRAEDPADVVSDNIWKRISPLLENK